MASGKGGMATMHSSVYPASPGAKWQSSGTGQGTGIFDGSEATIARQWQATLLKSAVSVLGHSKRYAASARASTAASTHQRTHQFRSLAEIVHSARVLSRLCIEHFLPSAR